MRINFHGVSTAVSDSLKELIPTQKKRHCEPAFGVLGPMGLGALKEAQRSIYFMSKI